MIAEAGDGPDWLRLWRCSFILVHREILQSFKQTSKRSNSY